MSKADVFENDLLKLLFNATPIANIADNAAASPLTNLYVSLHTGDPGEAGDQTTNEIAYTGYARVAVLRNGTGWTITGNAAKPAAAITFGLMTGGSPAGPVMYFGVGTLVSGTGKLLYSGTVTPNITMSNGVTPQLTTASQITED